MYVLYVGMHHTINQLLHTCTYLFEIFEGPQNDCGEAAHYCQKEKKEEIYLFTENFFFWLETKARKCDGRRAHRKDEEGPHKTDGCSTVHAIPKIWGRRAVPQAGHDLLSGLSLVQ